MINPKEAFSEILQEAKAYFTQFPALDCFSVSDLSLFPKQHHKLAPKEPPLAVPPISLRPKISQIDPVKEEKKPVKEAAKEPEKDEFCILAPLKQETVQPLNNIGETILRIAPHFKILWDIPNDADANAIKNRWQVKQVSTVIVLLTGEKNKESLLFLENLAKAITKQFATAQVIQIEKIAKFEFFEGAKAIIAVEKEIQESKLLPHYRKIPTTSENFLKDIPLIVMSPPSHYLAKPSEKRILWNDICLKIPRLLLPRS